MVQGIQYVSLPTMPKNVLIILGHSVQNSFGSAIAARYQTEAQSAGHSVQTIELAHLSFDPILHQGYKGSQALEPGLQQAQSQIKWANEIVLVFPIWWGGMPALLKGFLDRTLLPGFAFKYEPTGKGLEALLKGRTARVIMTMDTPRWIDRWIYGSPVIRQLRMPILRFCGIKLTHTLYLAPIIKSTASQREAWLDKVAQLAKKA